MEKWKREGQNEGVREGKMGEYEEVKKSDELVRGGEEWEIGDLKGYGGLRKSEVVREVERQKKSLKK